MPPLCKLQDVSFVDGTLDKIRQGAMSMETASIRFVGLARRSPKGTARVHGQEAAPVIVGHRDALGFMQDVRCRMSMVGHEWPHLENTGQPHDVDVPEQRSRSIASRDGKAIWWMSYFQGRW